MIRGRRIVWAQIKGFQNQQIPKQISDKLQDVFPFVTDREIESEII
jgi:hypothetical protein